MGFKANFGTGDFSSVPYGTQDPAFENSVIGDWDRRIPDIETYDPEKKSGSCSIKTSSKTLVFQMFAHGYHGYHQDLPIFFCICLPHIFGPQRPFQVPPGRAVPGAGLRHRHHTVGHHGGLSHADHGHADALPDQRGEPRRQPR